MWKHRLSKNAWIYRDSYYPFVKAFLKVWKSNERLVGLYQKFINFYFLQRLSSFKNKVKVTPRDNHRYRYKKVALLVDGVQKALTPDRNDWVTGPFNMLTYGSESTVTGREFKLDWTKEGDDQFAQVKFIEIDYVIASGSKNVFHPNKKNSWTVLYEL